MSRRLLAVCLTLCLAVAGCAPKQVTGQATTPAGAGKLTPTTSATPTALPPAKAGTVLLKRSELGEILGVPEMKEVDHYTRTAAMKGVEPYDCISRLLLGTMNTADGVLEGNGNTSPDGRFAGQVAAVYEEAQLVDAQLGWILRSWATFCPDAEQLTITDGEIKQTWTAGPVDPPIDNWTNPRDVDRVSTVTRRQEPSPRTCAHVLAAFRTVLVESMTCGPDDAAIGQAATIADRIAAKLPK